MQYSWAKAYPTYLTIRFGRLQISISQNYHSDGKPRERGDNPLVYGIAIRKAEPFVLDFSNKPAVMFAAPGKAATKKPSPC